uniref:Apple domain-containing protein n=1 Tax=Plectus sambesii TaxID=2011161 RepID=A0A914XDR4_9BILA
MNLRLFSLCLMVSFLLKATSGQDGMGSTGGPSGSSGEPMGSSGGPEPEGSTGGPEGSTGGPEGSTGGPVPEASTGGPEPEASTGGPEPEASTGGPEGSTGESTDGGPIATTPLATPEATTSTASPGTKIHSSSSGATKPVTPPPVTHGTPPPVTQPTVKPTLPPAGEACTVPKVDPRSKMSNFGETLVVPNVTDCLPVCKSNTKFECQAYIWKGPGAGCILYGNIQHGATKLSNSPWTLVDLKCASS